MKEQRIATDISDIRLTSLNRIMGQKQVVDTLQMTVEAHFKMRSYSNTSSRAFGPAVFTGPRAFENISISIIFDFCCIPHDYDRAIRNGLKKMMPV